MKTIYYSYASYGQVFWNENEELILGIHENDAEFRAEYMNPLFEAVGAKIVHKDEIPQKVKEDECFENYGDIDD